MVTAHQADVYSIREGRMPYVGLGVRAMDRLRVDPARKAIDKVRFRNRVGSDQTINRL